MDAIAVDALGTGNRSFIPDKPDEGFDVLTKMNNPLLYFLQSSTNGLMQSVPIYGFTVTKSTSKIDCSVSPIFVFPK